MNIDITDYIKEIKYKLKKLKPMPWQSPFIDCIDTITKNIVNNRHKYGYSCDISPHNVNDQLYEIIIKHEINMMEDIKNRYDNDLDIVSIMPFEMCKNYDTYQSVILHEICHWTKTSDRTDRDRTYDSPAPWSFLDKREECVAETAAIILHKILVKSPDLSITSNSIQYINSFLDAIYKNQHDIIKLKSTKTKLYNKTILPLAVEASNFLLAPLDIQLEYQV